MQDQAGATPEAKAGDDVTQLLAAARNGDQDATHRLFALIYDDLRQLAGRHVRNARGGPSATSLVHEVYLRLAQRDSLSVADRTHLFAVASRAMRQIVIDAARRRQTDKRGGGQADADLAVVGFALAAPAAASSVEELLSLDGALSDLEREEPHLAQTVAWHFFAGLTLVEIAEARGVSERTVQREWRAARALLHDSLAGDAGAAG